MGLIKVRDFAAAVGCTPQNIYKHIRKYKAELDGHVTKGRQSLMLDEFACDFIREAMYPKEVSTDDTVHRLEQQVAELRTALFEAMKENVAQKAQIVALEGERDKALMDVSQHQKLLTAAEDEMAEKEAVLEDAKRMVEHLEQDLESANHQKWELERENKEQATEIHRLQTRGLWARIRNK